MNANSEFAITDLSDLISHSGISIYSQDLELRYTQSLTDYSVEQKHKVWNGKTAQELFPGNEKEIEELNSLKKLVIKDKVVRRKDFNIHINRTLRSFDVFIQAKENKNGEVVGVNCLSFENTERKQQEEILKKSEKNLKEAEKIAHLGHFEYDLIKRKFNWSEEACRIFGRNPNDKTLTGDEYIAMIHNEDRVKASNQFLLAVQKGLRFEMVYRIVKLDGSIRHIKRKAEVVRDSTGTPIKAFGTILDFTDQVESENWLKEQKRFIQEITDASQSIITILDLQKKRMVFSNKGAESILGYDNHQTQLKQEAIFNLLLNSTSKEEFYNHFPLSSSPIPDFLHPNDEQFLFDPYWKIINARGDQRNKTHKLDFRVRHNNNHWVWIHEKWIPFARDEKGQITKILMVGTDVTQLKNSENAARNAILEGQELERQRIAADLHDAINPLLSISKLNLESLKELIQTNRQDKFAKVDNAIELLERSMKEIREISRNLMPSVLRDFGLIQALKDLCNKITQGGTLSVNFDHHGISERIAKKVEVSLFRISQELLNNIIKHAKASKAELQLILQTNLLILMIHDNGVGFNRDSTQILKNGLGFQNTESRVKSLGGIMHIDAAEGRGTTITIKIPIEQES